MLIIVAVIQIIVASTYGLNGIDGVAIVFFHFPGMELAHQIGYRLRLKQDLQIRAITSANSNI